MAKLTGRMIDGFIANPDKKYRVVLLFGADSGLAHERSRAIAKTVVEDLSDPFRVAQLSGPQLASEPALLAEESAAISMMGGQRVVFLRDAGDRNAQQVSDFLADPVGDALVLVLAGELPARSKLRKTCEAAGNAAAIPCYLDDPSAIASLIDSVLGVDDVHIDRDARDYLIDHLGQDRASSRGEIEKLALYAGRGGNLTIADIRESIGDSAAPALDDVLYAAFDGRARDLDRALEQLSAMGSAPVSILRAASSHSLRLRSVQGSMAAGKDLKVSMQALWPKVFYKLESSFAIQVRLWTGPRIADALSLLMQAESDCKKTGATDGLICSRSLHQIAAMAARAKTRTSRGGRSAR